MTRAETTDIFALLMLAYPQAEMVRAENQAALEAKLAPTVTLWATCLKDVDFWTAQQATILLCQRCKFPPTIAEMREAAADVAARTRSEVEWAYMTARGEVNSLRDGEGLEVAYQRLSPRCRKTIDAMGGMEAFAPPDKPFFNMTGFESTYERLLRANPVGLPGQNAKQIAG